MDKSYLNEQREGYVCKGTARAKTRKWEWWGWPRTHLTKGHHLLCWGVRHLGEKSNAENAPNGWVTAEYVLSTRHLCGLFRLCRAVLSHTDAAFPFGGSQSNQKAGRQREGRQAHCNLKLEDPSLLGEVSK